VQISWKRNFYILWVAQAAALLGFQSVQPFLPYYVQVLGVKDLSEAAVWAGYMGTASGLAMALSAPFWGAMADRFGRRPMVVRAMLGGGLTVLLMAYARTPLELVLARFLQGLLAGSVTACITLVSTSTPRAHLGYALGMMQSAMMVGAAVGMMGGGALIDGIGYRDTFLIAGVVVVLAGLSVQIWVREDFQPDRSRGETKRKSGVIADTRAFLRLKPFRIVLVCLMLTQFAFGVIMPVTPLFLQELAQTDDIASIAGFIFSASMLAGGVLSVVLGSLSDRFGANRMLTGGLLATAVLYALQGFSTTVLMLGTLQVIAGITKGAIRPVANVLLTQSVSATDRGKAFGVMASATALGWAVGPAFGGYLSVHWGFRSVFGVTALLFVLVGVWVWRAMRGLD
jgi:DHA1 family multidrug resistance protein-like MFS transporter